MLHYFFIKKPSTKIVNNNNTECADKFGFEKPTGIDGIFLCNMGYAVLYNPKTKTPIYSAEYLDPNKVNDNNIKRENTFYSDPRVDNSPRPEDYTRSGYDRGHMAPNGNMDYDRKAAVESFYMTNIVPQVGKNMNRGIWATLEKQTRSWAQKMGGVYVLTGPIYHNKPYRYIKNNIAIPDAFYKIVYNRNGETIAFIMNNEEIQSKNPQEYVVSVTNIESLTGMSFLPSNKYSENINVYY